MTGTRPIRTSPPPPPYPLYDDPPDPPPPPAPVGAACTWVTPGGQVHMVVPVAVNVTEPDPIGVLPAELLPPDEPPPPP